MLLPTIKNLPSSIQNKAVQYVAILSQPRAATKSRPPPLESEPAFLFLLRWLLCLLLCLALCFAEDAVVGKVVVNHVIGGLPIEAPPNVAVVDIEVGVYLPGVVIMLTSIGKQCLVDGAELHAALAAPFHGLVEEPALSHGPQHEFVTVFH